ncbi:NAD(P)H-hydrate dehydratase [Thioclava sp. SK-1]|uniref:NAD(P)H-hydrate dehydratase n=1 Tax=Thioclava sp. SK-1 TaxID=1889770 RepID=UPI00082615D4|nr:NAD(P)H-hydrate dehydratase [Thioclava sp. SK-1]
MTTPLDFDSQRIQSLGKRSDQHKYDHGHALVLSGGPGRGGAARLAARAALRVGAGLVTICSPQSAMAENAAQLSSIMLSPLPDSYTLRGILSDDRVSAVCLGPGLGVPRALDMVPAALYSKRATVLDADALTAFEQEPEMLFNHLHPQAIITPHRGEFGRLFPDLAQADSQAAATQAAARAGCTVLLKGEDTWIAEPDGRSTYLSCRGARAVPWLATAGSGDVLAGLIAGLMARGHAGFDAACTAALLHAQAARSFGPGLISEDLPDLIPQVLRDLGVA